MGNDADSHDLLSVVATVHHDRVGQSASHKRIRLKSKGTLRSEKVPLHNRALRLTEALRGVATGRVREIDRRPNLDVVAVLEIIKSAKSGSVLAGVCRLDISDFVYILKTTYVKEISLISTSSL